MRVVLEPVDCSSPPWCVQGRVLASVRCSVALLTVLALVLAAATILEARHGREVAEWFIYTSPWFIALLGVLGLNLLAATVLAANVVRWPWPRSDLGLVVTHAGLVVLLVGALQTIQFGIKGQVVLRVGQRTDMLTTPQRSVITVERLTATQRFSSQLAFHPGAVDWRVGKSLDFGDAQTGDAQNGDAQNGDAQNGGAQNGDAQDLALKVLAFYRHAQPSIAWVPDEQDSQGSALRLQLADRNGLTIAEDWLTASAYGGEVLIGPTRYVLLPIAVESMLQDFLYPPSDTLGQAGVLSMHYGGQMYRVSIDEKWGSACRWARRASRSTSLITIPMRSPCRTDASL